MIAVTMFWAALMAGFFFVLSAFFKVVEAAVNAILPTIGQIILVLLGCGAAGGGLYVLYNLKHYAAENGATETFFHIIATVALYVIIVVLVWAFVGWLMKIMVCLGVLLIAAVSQLFERIVSVCDTCFSYFLGIITSCQDKC